MCVDVVHILVFLFDFDFPSKMQSTKIFPPGPLYPLDTEADAVATSNHQETAWLQRCDKE